MYDSALMRAIVLMQELHATADGKIGMIELVKEAKTDYGFCDALGDSTM